MKLIISGASGFVGSNLIRYLENKDTEIICVSRDNNGSPKQMSWKSIFQQELNADVIIHLAGKAHDLKNTSEPGSYFDVNTELTKKFFDAFLRSSASTFIFMSSVKAAADAVDGILTEDVSPDPKTVYGQSKLKAEEYILKADVPVDKRVFILRPCMIHGPGNKGNLNLLYQFVKRGVPYPLAAFENKRSFLSVSNLNFIIATLIADKQIIGGIYNVADDMPLSTNKVINIISEANGLKAKLWNINKRIVETAARIGDKLRLPLNTERLKKLTESYIVSNQKIKEALHIDHLPVSSTEGLAITIKSFSTR